jgi:8-oxo-dGTP pyrophosphatase MutT (NUDIX family)
MTTLKKFSAGTFILQDGKILSVAKPDGVTTSLPCGKVDPGEEVMAAAVRETFEETGYHVRIITDVHPFMATEGEFTVVIFPAVIVDKDMDHVVAPHEGTPDFRDPHEITKGKYKRFNASCLKFFGVQ